MRHFPATPVEMVASLWRNRSLIHASARREVLGRYRGLRSWAAPCHYLAWFQKTRKGFADVL
jgi:uncharacterized protein (DUF3820 family)